MILKTNKLIDPLETLQQDGFTKLNELLKINHHSPTSSSMPEGIYAFRYLFSTQEQRREFQFLQVQSGNGIYIWNDYDSNGLKTLNEFELASELDKARADYIKIYTPVAGFITTNSTKVTQTLELNPAVFVSKNAKKKAFIGRFNSFSTLMIDKKVLPRLATFLINLLIQLQI